MHGYLLSSSILSSPALKVSEVHRVQLPHIILFPWLSRHQGSLGQKCTLLPFVAQLAHTREKLFLATTYGSRLQWGNVAVVVDMS